MPSEIMNALKMVANEKSIDVDDLVETIRQAVTIAAGKRMGRENLTALFNAEKGVFDLYEILEVRETVEDPNLMINLEDALAIDPSATIGAEIKRQVVMEGLGRIAAQSVRQMIHKKGRELEWHRLYLAYQARAGEMVTGRLTRKGRDSFFFDLGDVSAVLPPEEQAGLDYFERGRNVKLLIVEVNEGKYEPLVVVSRNRAQLIRKLVELETPELAEGTVEIVAAVRDPSGRAKIAVRSRKGGVDPVGACVGVRGNRIQPVARELNGEKIDVFAWSDDPEKLIALSLAPVKDVKVIPFANEKKAYAVVPDDQLPTAIGKKGVNVRLASELTGWELDVMSNSEYEEYRRRIQKKNKQGKGPGRT